VLAAGVLLVMVLLAGAGGAVWFMDKINNFDRVDDLNVDAVAAGEPSNYLVVGSDTRATSDGEFGDVGGQRSDTIMIVRLDPQAEQASVLSLPRDLMVSIAGHDSTEREKLNSAYAESHQTLVDTIRLNFGIEINHYVVIDFVGFQRLVDAVGGVPIWTDRALKDEESGLYVDQLGCVTLNGEQALAYARSRHLQYMTEDGDWSSDDPLQDLGRIQRQQIFIRSALAQVLGEVRSNPLRVTEFVDIGVDSVTLDPETDPFDLADQFTDFSLDDLQSYALPVVDLEPRVSVQMDPVNAPPVLAIFRGEDPNDVPAGSITVDVLNGTGVDNQANDAAAAFQAVGFRLGERSDYQPQPVEHTIVFHRPNEEIMGLRVARHITGGAQLQVQEDLESGHVVVVTGQDFTTIHMQPTPVDQMPTTVPDAPAGGGEQTTTTTAAEQASQPPETTPTTLSEYTIGQIPEGVDCG
jgi:polyisoprenyl-teichoic acid--peptidoglycan teichoic acid transferase